MLLVTTSTTPTVDSRDCLRTLIMQDFLLPFLALAFVKEKGRTPLKCFEVRRASARPRSTNAHQAIACLTDRPTHLMRAQDESLLVAFLSR